MAKRQLSPGFGRFEFRPGIKGFPLQRGMNRQLDPGAIPANQYYWLQNVRVLDGEIVSRGGASKVNTNAETGCILGLFDNLEPSSTGEMMMGVNANSGGLGLADKVLTDIFGTTTSDISVSGINGIYAMMLDSSQSYVYFSRSATGGNALDVYRVAVSGITGNTPSIYFSSTSTADTRRAGSIAEFGSKIWLGQAEDKVNGLTKVYSYDGASLVEEDSFAASSGGSLSALLGVSHNNLLTYGFRFIGRDPSGAGVIIPAIRVRSGGGTWSSVDLPTTWGVTWGRLQFFSADTVTFNGKTWFCGWNRGDGTFTTGNMVSWDGSSSTVVDEHGIQTFLSGTADRDYINSMCVLNGYLYYLWMAFRSSTVWAVKIGRTDGVTFDDNYLDLLAQYPSLADTPQGTGYGLRVFNGKLSCILKVTSSADANGLFITAADEPVTTFTTAANLTTVSFADGDSTRGSPTYAGPFQLDA